MFMLSAAYSALVSCVYSMRPGLQLCSILFFNLLYSSDKTLLSLPLLSSPHLSFPFRNLPFFSFLSFSLLSLPTGSVAVSQFESHDAGPDAAPSRHGPGCHVSCYTYCTFVAFLSIIFIHLISFSETSVVLRAVQCSVVPCGAVCWCEFRSGLETALPQSLPLPLALAVSLLSACLMYRINQPIFYCTILSCPVVPRCVARPDSSADSEVST